ncbi:MAG: class I SAM-dependent RNA methyltransferase [Chloroflexi bacterium]|nr:class I SAM-dependent RNA methyltransferase [Chloroflexota bacterium]
MLSENKITLIAVMKFGLESIVKNEILALGFGGIRVSDGKIEFDATLEDIPRANLWLRCADRLFLKMGQFPALTFDELFEQTKALPWESLITADGKFTVNAKAVKSTLRSVRSCQSIVKKAVVDRLRAHYHVEQFPETGPEFTIQASILRDTAVLAIDTSGIGLHKRGYRADAGEAPLKETLAAGLVLLSSWRQDEMLIDPMCGSGTILIEAAMIARNIAPGLNREFASEKWPSIPEATWRRARQSAREAIISGKKLQLYGYDINAPSVEICQSNAQKASVAGDIAFAQKDVKTLWIDRQYGAVISNPPYGMRMAEFKELNDIYLALHKIFRKKMGWSLHILTADKKFPRYFKRARPDRVRKLYNGRIQVNYYQYHAERN